MFLRAALSLLFLTGCGDELPQECQICDTAHGSDNSLESQCPESCAECADVCD